MIIFAGCGLPHGPDASDYAAYGSTFLATGPRSECTNLCWSETAPLLRAGLGLDTFAPEPEKGTDSEALIAGLRMASGGTSGVTKVSPLDTLRRVEGGGDPGILTDKNGHFYLLLAYVNVESKGFFQVVHGNSSIFLIPRESLRAMPFEAGWEVGRSSERGVPIAVGDSKLVVEKLFHNFGLIRPGQSCETSFRLKNSGERAVQLWKPTTSCGCTTTSVLSDTILEPGEHVDLQVSLNASKAASIRQFVQMTVSSPEEINRPRTFQLSLFASEVLSMSVQPGSLNFGTVVPGNHYHQTVFLSEVTTDRFRVTGVSSPDVQLTCSREEQEDHHGLKTFKLNFLLTPNEETLDAANLMIIIQTTSKFMPKVKIPVAFKLKPFATAVPGVVALGEVEIGRPYLQTVSLSARDGSLTGLEIEECPDEVSVDISHKLQTELTLTVTPRKTGIWQGVIKGKVRVGTREERFEIPCSAYVRGRRGAAYQAVVPDA